MLQGSSPIVQVVVAGPHDNEWLKNIVSLGVGVLVGVVLGLFSALYLEPMKFRRLRKIHAAEARELIYEELGAILASLKLAIPMGDALCANISERSRPSTITVGRGKKSHFDEHKQDKQYFGCVGSFGA